MASLKSERIIAHNLVVGSSTVAAGLLGVAFQSLFSHRLQPAEYGGVFAVVSLISLLGLPTSSISLLLARETSRDQASDVPGHSYALFRYGNLVLLFGGTCLAVAVIAGAETVSGYFRIPQVLLVAAAVGIPFTLALSVPFGRLQGQQRFTSLAGLSVAQAAIKLALAVVVSSVIGPAGIVAGISLATAIVYVTARLMTRDEGRSSSVRLAWTMLTPAARYLAIVLPSTLALGLLLTADVLLVKHFFAAHAAGEYAAVAALGRAIFWGATAVATVLFPKVVVRGARGQHAAGLVIASVLIVALGGAAGLAVLSVGSRSMLLAFSGAAYADAAVYLPWYSIGMIMLGIASVLIATHQSRGTAHFLIILLPLSALEPALILLFHNTLAVVVVVIDISTAALASALAALYFVEHQLESRRVTTLTGPRNAISGYSVLP